MEGSASEKEISRLLDEYLAAKKAGNDSGNDVSIVKICGNNEQFFHKLFYWPMAINFGHRYAVPKIIIYVRTNHCIYLDYIDDMASVIFFRIFMYLCIWALFISPLAFSSCEHNFCELAANLAYSVIAAMSPLFAFL